ncbi:MAG TPA: HAMP domain-containing sensor histidine kinase [Candidatus Limnocylindrales bacterium]|nr:HAMP domain-containing sensor histidine kinase [Candidatus Limnocylindrales bacterium]
MVDLDSVVAADPDADADADADADPTTVGRPGRRSRFHRPRLIPRMIRRAGPKSLQARLTLGFASVVALSLLLVTVFVLNRLDDEFRTQQIADLQVRAQLVSEYVDTLNKDSAQGLPVVFADNHVNPDVADELGSNAQARFIADRLAEADVDIVLGLPSAGGADAGTTVAAIDGSFHASVRSPSRPGLTKETLRAAPLIRVSTESDFPYVIEVRLSNPYTFRQSAIDNVTTVTAAVGALALGIAVLVAAALALRVTTPLRRMTEASRALAEGELGRRIQRADIRSGSSEIAALAAQFNAMADQLEASVAMIRRDRDRSRDFLADVSHELRTPIAALLTFNELLTERTGDDPAARAEFLNSSRIQLERLDWLAQNLLELSKLDSGLVLLDLRPDDLRAAVESAVEQAGPAARRRGVALRLEPATAPIRLRHDPQRIGQVVTNLVGNAIKFTEPGGSVAVSVAAVADGGARIEVADTGVGIEPAELPRIFERFYRGSRANEARGSGSGLGLAIVRSIVDMHRGTVEVVSRLGAGTTFTVNLPADPRREDDLGTTASTTLEPPTDLPKMVDSSPTGAPHLNRETSG